MPEQTKSGTPQWDAAVRGESLSWFIVRQIRDALFSKKLKPGDFLGSETNLGQQFEVSRMAARDALRSLSAMGIVEVRMGSRGGAWIAAGNSERLVDALAIQLQLLGLAPEELLEAQSATSVVAAELAAERASQEDFERLRVAAKAVEQATDDPAAFTAASLRFREIIVESSKNRALLTQLRAFESVMRPLLVANTTPGSIRRILKSNASLLKAITTRDAQAAGTLMREREASIRARLVGSEHSTPAQGEATDGRDRTTTSP